MTHSLAAVILQASMLLPVNFVLSSPGPVSAVKVAGVSTDQPGQADPAIETVRPQPHFSKARGFGKHVALSFAVRQIVPPGVAVIYGSGVAPDVQVDWVGDAPWNRVLQAAVAPLGWHAIIGKRSVRIVSD